MKTEFTRRDYLLHGLYFNLYGLVKYCPPPLGDAMRRLFSRPFVKKLGKARLREGVTLWFPYRLELADQVTLNEFVYLNAYGGLAIEQNVRIGHMTSVITSDHRFEDRETPVYQQGIEAAPVRIREDAWLGAHVTILKGVTVGRGAVIAAGAVVTMDVPDYAIAAGVPAKVVGMRGEKSPGRSTDA
jgi:acetyltransferase-like isoleucine patch superfamily enzyme